MAIGSGLDSQFGCVAEVTYGTFVVPTRFLPFEKEGIKHKIDRQEISGGLSKTNNVMHSDFWLPGKKGSEGSIDFIVLSKGFGLIFKHMLGAVAITTPGGGTASRDHTHTLGDLTGSMMTTQIGKPDTGGTVRAFSYLGSKITEWELKGGLDSPLELSINIDARDETTAEALASKSLATGAVPLNWIAGTFTVAAASPVIRSISIKGNNGLEADRHGLGSALKSQPIQEGLREISGDVEVEFGSLTEYNLFLNGTLGAIVAKWQGPLIEGALYNHVEVTLPACRFDGDTPVVESAGRLLMTMPFKALNNGTDQPISLVYRTVDTAS